MAGRRMAARMARMATMHTTSRRVKPASPGTPSTRPAGDVGCCSGSTFLPVRAVGDAVIGPMLPRRAVEVRISPRIVGDDRALQIRAVPRHGAARALYESGQPFRARRVTSVVEKVQIERAPEAFDLDLGGLRLRFGQVIEHAR